MELNTFEYLFGGIIVLLAACSIVGCIWMLIDDAQRLKKKIAEEEKRIQLIKRSKPKAV